MDEEEWKLNIGSNWRKPEFILTPEGLELASLCINFAKGDKQAKNESLKSIKYFDQMFGMAMRGLEGNLGREDLSEEIKSSNEEVRDSLTQTFSKNPNLKKGIDNYNPKLAWKSLSEMKS